MIGSEGQSPDVGASSDRVALNAPRTPWCVLLAAGAGTRLQALTTFGGVTVPKQYCAVGGGSSLLQLALRRARRIVPDERIVVVVDVAHHAWWSRQLDGLPADNIVRQPCNRGTAAGILLPLTRIVARDPRASIAFFPTDHYVADEWTLATAVLAALAETRREPSRLNLLGVAPDDLGDSGGRGRSDLGWILPARRRPFFEASPVDGFYEKPANDWMPSLLARGAAVNTFILAARASAVLGAYEIALPALLDLFALHEAGTADSDRLEALYAGLTTRDFSSDLLERVPELLSLIRVPSCGWNDLGTPARLAKCFERAALGGGPAPLIRPLEPVSALAALN